MKGLLLEDLPENRAGRISFAQRLRIAVRILLWMVWLLIALAAIVGCSVTGGRIWWAVLGPCAGALVLYVGNKIYCYGRDCLDGAARSLEGVLRKNDHYPYWTNSYFDNECIICPRGGLIAGKRYRLYFTPRGKRLLNAELLEESVRATLGGKA